MVRTVKRSLRKVLGTARVSYEELQTLLTEIESRVNSRPLTSVSSEDVEEPLSVDSITFNLWSQTWKFA